LSTAPTPPRRYRSQDWFDNPAHIDMTALYLERFMNYGITAAELRSGQYQGMVARRQFKVRFIEAGVSSSDGFDRADKEVSYEGKALTITR
jgi:hypothetical protein